MSFVYIKKVESINNGKELKYAQKCMQLNMVLVDKCLGLLFDLPGLPKLKNIQVIKSIAKQKVLKEAAA